MDADTVPPSSPSPSTRPSELICSSSRGHLSRPSSPQPHTYHRHSSNPQKLTIVSDLAPVSSISYSSTFFSALSSDPPIRTASSAYLCSHSRTEARERIQIRFRRRNVQLRTAYLSRGTWTDSIYDPRIIAKTRRRIDDGKKHETEPRTIRRHRALRKIRNP